MKPYSRRNVHADARTMVAPIADVIVLNVTTMVWPITYVVLRHAASPVVIHAASAALGCVGDRWDSSQGSDPDKQCMTRFIARLLNLGRIVASGTLRHRSQPSRATR